MWWYDGGRTRDGGGSHLGPAGGYYYTIVICELIHDIFEKDIISEFSIFFATLRRQAEPGDAVLQLSNLFLNLVYRLNTAGMIAENSMFFGLASQI